MLRESFLLPNFFQKGQTITGECYATLLNRLHEKIRTQRPKFTHKKNPLSSRQRTGSHFRSFNGKRTWISVQTFASSTLLSWFVSSDFFLFPNVKIWLGERDFHLMRRLSPLWMSILRGYMGFEGQKKAYFVYFFQHT